jgi:hypothetical protein
MKHYTFKVAASSTLIGLIHLFVIAKVCFEFSLPGSKQPRACSSILKNSIIPLEMGLIDVPLQLCENIDRLAGRNFGN